MSIATFLFTDIVGSTAHVLRLGDEGWKALLGEYRGIVRGELELSGGCEVDNAGDGLFARMMACARRGKVLASHTVQQHAGSTRLLDAGAHVLEGVPGHWPLFRAA